MHAEGLRKRVRNCLQKRSGLAGLLLCTIGLFVSHFGNRRPRRLRITRFAAAYRYFFSASSLRTLTSPRSMRTAP